MTSSVMVQTLSSLRDSHPVWNKLPGTPLTLRAGLLSGRAYRHFVHKDDRIFPEAAAQLAVDEADPSCLSEPY